MPAGTVPTTGRYETELAAQTSLAVAPIPKTPLAIRNGRTYYGYYCLMCHGEKGDGNGPVGESYDPKPADLTSPKYAKLNDGQLLNRMLHGEGHDPVMAQTVQPEHRWPLLLYVRTLTKKK
jgi:mono/diheme cytochrome c family protein